MRKKCASTLQLHTFLFGVTFISERLEGRSLITGLSTNERFSLILNLYTKLSYKFKIEGFNGASFQPEGIYN